MDDFDETQLFINKMTEYEIRKKGGVNSIYANMLLNVALKAKEKSKLKSRVLKVPVVMDTDSKKWRMSLEYICSFLKSYKMEKTISAIKSELVEYDDEFCIDDDISIDEKFKLLFEIHKERVEFFKKKSPKIGGPTIPTLHTEENTKNMINSFLSTKQIAPIVKESRQTTASKKVEYSRPSRPAATASAQELPKRPSNANSYVNPPPKQQRPSMKWHGKEIIEPELEPIELDDIDEFIPKPAPKTKPKPQVSYNRFGLPQKREDEPKQVKQARPKPISIPESVANETPSFTSPKQNQQRPKAVTISTREEKRTPSFTSPRRKEEPLPKPPKLPKESKRPQTLDGYSYTSKKEWSDNNDDFNSIDELNSIIEGDSGPSTLDSDSIFRSGGPMRRRPSADQSSRTTKRYKDGSLVRRRKNDPLERISRVYTLDDSSVSDSRSKISLYDSFSSQRRSSSQASTPRNQSSYKHEETPEERHQRHKEERRRREEEERKAEEERQRRKREEEKSKKKSENRAPGISAISRRFLELDTSDLEDIDENYRGHHHHHHHSSDSSDSSSSSSSSGHHHHHSSDHHHHSSERSDSSGHHHHHHESSRSSSSSSHHHHSRW